MNNNQATFDCLRQINDRIYREANNLYYPDTTEMLLKIARYSSLANEKGIIRQNINLTVYYCVMTLSWAMAFANRLGNNLDVAKELYTHFSACPYCTILPCGCVKGVPKPTRSFFYPKDYSPSVHDFQQHIARIYPANTLIRSGSHLAAESLELVESLMDWKRVQFDPTLSKRAHELILEEYADTIAHIAAVAHCGQFDLGENYVRIFENGCPGCKEIKCRCGYTNTGQLISV